MEKGITGFKENKLTHERKIKRGKCNLNGRIEGSARNDKGKAKQTTGKDVRKGHRDTDEKGTKKKMAWTE
jgi:hypothetical protein